jgi:hypothetical protein
VKLFLLLIALASVSAAQQEPPLPIVTRSRPDSGYVFDTPSLVAWIRVKEETKSETPNDEPGASLTVTANPRFGSYVKAYLLRALRVNERRVDEPDLQNRYLTIDLGDAKDNPLPLKLGHLYVLLIKTTPELLRLRGWHAETDQFLSVPPYTLAISQGGFEVVGGSPGPNMEGRRLRVLRKGGPLDLYDGRLFDDVAKELKEHR